MRTLQRDDPLDALAGVRLGIQQIAEALRVGRLDPTELHSAVEPELAAIGAVAGDVGARPDQTSSQATLDAAASHLLAAVDASLSGVRPEVVADLLWRAADRLRVAA